MSSIVYPSLNIQPWRSWFAFIGNLQALNNFIEGLGLIILLSLIGLCFIALLITLSLLLPGVAERSHRALQKSPWPAFFIGLANYVFLGGLSLFLFNVGPRFLGAIGLMIVAFLTMITACGLLGVVAQVSQSLQNLQAGQISPLKGLLWGSLLLTLAGALPFIGWFLFTPLTLMTAFGGAVLAWRNREPLTIDD